MSGVPLARLRMHEHEIVFSYLSHSLCICNKREPTYTARHPPDDFAFYLGEFRLAAFAQLCTTAANTLVASLFRFIHVPFSIVPPQLSARFPGRAPFAVWTEETELRSVQCSRLTSIFSQSDRAEIVLHVSRV